MPSKINVVIVKSASLNSMLFYVYSKNVGFVFGSTITNLLQVTYFSSCHSLQLCFCKKNRFQNVGKDQIDKLLFAFHTCFATHLEIKSTLYGFRGVRNGRIILRAGYTHGTKVNTTGIVTYRSRYSLELLGIDYKKLMDYTKQVQNIRHYNIYTQKGIFLEGERVYRKSGKVLVC